MMIFAKKKLKKKYLFEPSKFEPLEKREIKK
jgi:hypothetical protein